MLGWSLSIPGAILLHQQLNFWSCCCPQVWLPCRKVSAIPGDDLQKYHQMIQAEKHSLSPVPRIFFLDGTVSSELLQSLRTLSPSLGWGFQSQDSCKKTNYLPN